MSGKRDLVAGWRALARSAVTAEVRYLRLLADAVESQHRQGYDPYRLLEQVRDCHNGRARRIGDLLDAHPQHQDRR